MTYFKYIDNDAESDFWKILIFNKDTKAIDGICFNGTKRGWCPLSQWCIGDMTANEWVVITKEDAFLEMI